MDLSGRRIAAQSGRDAAADASRVAGLDESAVDRFARRQGITRQRLLTQVHDPDGRLLLVHRAASGAWELPWVWRLPHQSTCEVLAWLCQHQLGLDDWSAELLTVCTALGYDGDEILQLSLGVHTTLPARLPRPGRHLWWAPGGAPPPVVHPRYRGPACLDQRPSRQT